MVDTLNDAQLMGIKGFGESAYPYGLAYLVALPFFLLAYWKYLTSRGYLRESHKFAFELYWLAYGYYIVWRQVLRNASPKLLLISNDHNIWTRVALQAAKDEGIKTSYLQHASVSDRFPALSMDYAFLDGRDAIFKYDRIGPSPAKVFAVGVTKFDKYRAFINRKTGLTAVGICVNLVDPASRVEELCRYLVSSMRGVDFFLRPHPSDNKYVEWNKMASEMGMTFSNSRTTPSYQFLSQVDAIIACESNIQLEATLLNVFPIYYDFPSLRFDNYGFVRNGLVDSICLTPNEALRELERIQKQRPCVRHRAKPYCATVDTGHDGHTCELVASLIDGICSNGEMDWTPWKPIDGLGNLNAFEPV